MVFFAAVFERKAEAIKPKADKIVAEQNTEVLVDAIERRDARAAARLMESHLRNVERNLQLHPRVAGLSGTFGPLQP